MERHAEHLYSELRRMANSFMRRERSGHTLQPTALANEAFLSMGTAPRNWENTAHYFGAAANTMRQILVQHARARRAQKRGGGALRVTFDALPVAAEDASGDALQVRDALQALAEHDARLANLVEMRYMAGHTLEEIAEMSGRSLASLKRDWSYARAWLLDYLTN